jgi:hypothetical protein
VAKWGLAEAVVVELEVAVVELEVAVVELEEVVVELEVEAVEAVTLLAVKLVEAVSPGWLPRNQ